MKELEKDDLIKYLENKKYISDRRLSIRYFIDKYIKSRNVSMALDLTLHFYSIGDLLPADLIKIEDFLLQEKNPSASFRFVMNAPTKRLSSHEDIVLQANDPNLCESMATLKGADIEKHSRVILDANNPRISFNFLKKLPFVDKQEHLSVIANGADPFYMLEIGKQYKGIGCKKTENSLIKLNNPDYSLEYAKHVENSDINAHQMVVMFYGNAEQILDFANNVKTADLSFMIKRLCDKFKRLQKIGNIDEAKQLKVVLEELLKKEELSSQKEKE